VGSGPLAVPGTLSIPKLPRPCPAVGAAGWAGTERPGRDNRRQQAPEGDLPFGVPAAYWIDLRAYQPAAVAATLDQSTLILQGGRDYQVTVGRRPGHMGAWPRREARCDRSDLPCRQPFFLRRERAVGTGRVRARPAHGPSGRLRHCGMGNGHDGALSFPGYEVPDLVERGVIAPCARAPGRRSGSNRAQ
jgi:hypothetical protein